MNDRIRELVVESGNGQIRDGRLYPHIGSRTEADWQRFAELIVRECIDIIDITHGSKKLMRPDPYQKIIWAIEEHFGVEE